MDLALQTGAPFIQINDSGGARIQEGAASLAGYGYIFERNVRASGVIPQISVIMGPCAGGAVYSPAITDFTFMVKETSHMFITGPDVIKTVTGEDVTMEELGGAMTHAAQVAASPRFVGEDDEDVLQRVRYLLSFLPSNNLEDPPAYASTDDPERHRTRGSPTSIPDRAQGALRHARGDPLRRGRRRVPRGLPALGDEHRDRVRAAGRPVDRRHREPAEGAGGHARHRREREGVAVRPVLRRVQHPDPHLRRRARVPARDDQQEYNGIIRHGAKLLYAFAEATVPRMTVITRKAYGGAYLVMNSKHLRADVSFAWPTAEIAVMGAEGAVNVVFRKEIEKAADDPEREARGADPRVPRQVLDAVRGGRARVHRRRDRAGRRRGPG